MSIRVALHHRTVYQYDRPVNLSPQIIRLRPAPHCRTPILSYSLRVEPQNQFLNWQQDPQGNFLARFVFPDSTTRFSVDVALIAQMTVINPFDFFLEPYAEKFPFRYESWQAAELASFLEAPPPGPRLRALLDSISLAPAPSVPFLVALNQRLQHEIRYLIRHEPGVQSPEETLELASGSCRDTAWLFVHLLRHLGLAARFVSGYLIQLTPDVKPLDGPEGPQSDFTDLHAWVETYLPGAGWIGLDPTSGLFAGEGHIPLAATPEPASAAPVTGAVDPCQVEFHHHMELTRIAEAPRVTKPYSEQQWQAIDAMGQQVDRDLHALDVRLTMGGEPTLVSIDDMDGEEWNTTALGPAKTKMGADLLRRLQTAFAPGGLLHYGQGKWYPGESLPRWAMSCYWRADGVPLWNDPALAADPSCDYGFGHADAQRFAETLAATLQVDPAFVIAAYEDPLAYIHKERQLPVNVDPIDNKLDDPEERERLRRAFERGLGVPSGFVLPLTRAWKDGPAWQSGLWMLRARHLFLIPGDSPVGLRLPMPSLPWVSAAELPRVWEVDPMAPRGALPTPRRMAQVPRPPSIFQRQTIHEQPQASTEPAADAVRTALAVETRAGCLYVFLPPLASLEDWVELLAAIESTASSLAMPVMLEGYMPPADHRIRHFKVTPDPGVIEVNIHPSSNWRELADRTTILYEQARLARLGTEKFMLDGRHSGTGGGNHIVLGGVTPADSPFLRRPDLLRSLITFWLNHPSLSYLFSGLFIGPTSQAPRVDETRADSIYELEIALGLIPGPGDPAAPPWQIDRILRNLLVDVTGNTHRAEFCIDKLYSPDSAFGRLGLLELRAFEMPPHSRMSLVQQLLLRALIAWFWKEPYRASPVHWGTRLHDRFLLPHFVERDFGEVIAGLEAAGFAFDPAWFAPHLEFRFPFIGRVEYDGVELELRTAIEPWYVLGEEPAAGGTTRFVDSSVERLQVKVRGLTPERHVITCNGRRLPLTPSGIQNEAVAGVRYRAWQPPRCLHPTIPVHTPLVFDVLDAWSARSLGGCTYHVGHPGGRNYETFPVNANEAEARRAARFLPFSRTTGPVAVPAPEQNPAFPVTLDLRRGASF